MKNLLIICLLVFSSQLFAQEVSTHVTGLNLLEQKFRTMNYEEALRIADESVMQNENSANALIQRALLKIRLGMEEEAKLDLKKANKINPLAADLFGLNGHFGILNAIKTDGTKGFQKLSLENNINYYFDYIDNTIVYDSHTDMEINLIEQVIFEISTGNLDKASTIIREGLDNNQNSSLLWDLEGLIYYQQKKYSNAKDSFIKAIKLDPNFGIALFNLAMTEKHLGNLELAKSYIYRSIIIQENLIKAKFELAQFHKKDNLNDKAIKIYNEVISEESPEWKKALINRGLTKKYKGDFTGASIDINKAISFDERNHLLYFYKANILMIQGNTNKAIYYYDKSIALNKTFGLAYFNRGLANIKLNKHRQACDDFQISEQYGTQIEKDYLLFCNDL